MTSRTSCSPPGGWADGLNCHTSDLHGSRRAGPSGPVFMKLAPATGPVASGVAVGGEHLFIAGSGCRYLFEYTKTGTKVGWTAYNTRGTPDGDAECDNLSYAVPVFWARDVNDGHIRAFAQPAAGACVFGGG